MMKNAYGHFKSSFFIYIFSWTFGYVEKRLDKKLNLKS